MPDPQPADNSPPPLGRTAPLVLPIYQSSVYTFPDLDALDLVMNAEEPGFIYARDGHPNARLLAQQLAAAEGADWGLVCASGMAAIAAVLLGVLRQGDRVVASSRLYGKTTQLLQGELTRFGIEVTLVDTSDLDQVGAALTKPTRALFVETMSNPLLRLVDLPELAALAREHDCLLLVDNTFATPVLVRPLELGADVVIESLTKMIGGHSDVTLGLLCGRGELGTQLAPLVSTWGLSANPFECWLAVRGLATMDVRMRTASATAAGHPLQPVAGPHLHDAEPPGHDLAPLRQPRRETPPGHHRRAHPPVRRRRGPPAHPGGDPPRPGRLMDSGGRRAGRLALGCGRS